MADTNSGYERVEMFSLTRWSSIGLCTPSQCDCFQVTFPRNKRVQFCVFLSELFVKLPYGLRHSAGRDPCIQSIFQVTIFGCLLPRNLPNFPRG